MLNPYDMKESEQELVKLESIFNTQVDTQVILQLLIEKEVITREEVQQHREKVKQIPKYKAINEYIQTAKQQVEYYKNHKEEHLRDVFKAKMNGQIR